MTQKNTDYTKVNSFLIAGAIVVAAFAPGFYVAEPANGLTEEQVKTIVNDAVNGLKLSDADKVDAIYADIFEEDAWEGEAEVLALEELEDDNYEDLFEEMKDAGILIDDEDDIDRVVIKDVEFLYNEEVKFDVDDKDATVKLELKVYYEDLDGDDKKEYIDAIVTIEDGKVEKMIFNFD